MKYKIYLLLIVVTSVVSIFFVGMLNTSHALTRDGCKAAGGVVKNGGDAWTCCTNDEQTCWFCVGESLGNCGSCTGKQCPKLEAEGVMIIEPGHLVCGKAPQSSGGCSLASSGSKSSIPLYLLIPGFIMIRRLWRIYTT